jgi:predicted AlkP superfamily pyrophosphatase or phosphodiesterase
MVRLAAFVGLLIGVVFTGVLPAADAPTQGAVRHVVLVSIDGLAASYLNDPRAQLPTLRRLMQEGASAEGMLTSFPSVTWPSHTSLVTGVQPARHGVIGNSVWDAQRNRGVTYIGDPELTKQQAIRVPTLYDVAHRAGLSCGSVIWPCCNGAESLRWMIPDSNKPDLHARYTTAGFIDELKQADIDISQLGTWGWNKQYAVERDVLYTRVGNYLLEKHGVNLLLVHLINPDGVEHAYGPHTPEAYQAVAESDRRVAEIWATLEKPPLAGRSALFVVSDHGFAPYEKFIRPNVVFKEMGLIATEEQDKVTQRQAWSVAQGGSAFVYVLDASRRAEITAQLKQKLAALEGVAKVVTPDGYGPLGLPSPEANPESPHLVLLTGPGYSFDNGLAAPAVADAGGHKGTHGHDPAPAYMHATFIAAGAGIKPGAKLAIVRNTDVAPTIAHLMGLSMPDVDGRVLKEILAQ